MRVPKNQPKCFACVFRESMIRKSILDTTHNTIPRRILVTHYPVKPWQTHKT